MGNEAPAYSPITPPGSDDPKLLQLSQWAQRELGRIGQRFTNNDVVQYNVLFAAPEKPRDGMTVMADGSLWNPGYGSGAYVYFGGAWVFLGVQPYVPPIISSFSVHKNGTNQTGIVSSVTTQVTWPTETYDINSHFASNVWTPNAGKVAMKFGFVADGTIAAGTFVLAGITKNGATTPFKSTVNSNGGANSVTGFVDIEDIANGTDAYGAIVNFATSAGTGTIRGDATLTWFMGHWIGP